MLVNVNICEQQGQIGVHFLNCVLSAQIGLDHIPGAFQSLNNLN